MTIHDAKALIGLCIDEGLKQGVLKNKGEFEELFDYLDKYFANTDKMPSGSSEIQNGLEEAAEEWAKENYGVNYMDFSFTQDAAFRAMYHFRAGAKWQKEQDEKEQADLFTIVALDAAQRAKEQMMENALHGWLDEDNEPPYDLNVLCEEKIPFGKFKHGDKVRIIVVKKDSHE